MVYQNNTFSMLNDYPNDYFFFNLLYFFSFRFQLLLFAFFRGDLQLYFVRAEFHWNSRLETIFFWLSCSTAQIKLCAYKLLKLKIKIFCWSSFFFPSTLSWFFFSSHNFMKMLYRDHAGYYFKSLLCLDLTRKEREKINAYLLNVFTEYA